METRGASPPHHTVAAPARRPTPAPRRNATYYRVRKGDTLYSIAWRSNRDFRQLARWNGIRPPYVIYAGQLIRLKPFTTARARATTTRKAPAKPVRRPAPRTADRPKPRSRPRAAHARPARHPAKRGRLRWAWPARGSVVARFKAGDALHKGIKIAARQGSPVYAAEAGKVVYSGSGLIGYGRLIIIKHNDKYLSAYGHNRKLLVKQNQRVKRGQKIAEVGTANDGRALLHFEIRRDGKPVNPLALLPRHQM